MRLFNNEFFVSGQEEPLRAMQSELKDAMDVALCPVQASEAVFQLKTKVCPVMRCQDVLGLP